MKLICIGQNYKAHAAELGSKKLTEPLFFLKPDSAILLSQHPFVIPPFSNDVQHEVEVLIKISRLGKYIQPKFAYKYYDKIGLGIDFTARDLQEQAKAKGHPWEKAKAFDGSAVIGKWIDKNEIEELNDLNFRLEKNGKTVQQGNTADMIYSIDTIISYVSQFMTLKIGDVLFTGTPAGVSAVEPDDVLSGYISEKQMFNLKVK
ncbi:MAG: fumarylacetoacetate hydrolase family protein [Leeuwenhoekiella sp.]